MKKKYLLGLYAILGVFLYAGVAHAMYFADYVYQNMHNSQIEPIRKYLEKGYPIDAVNSEKLTALCLAIKEDDFGAYRKLRRLGANENHQCVQLVDEQKAVEFSERYLPNNNVYVSEYTPEPEPIVVKRVPVTTTYKSGSDITVGQYAAAGAVVAAGVAAAVIIADDDDGHKSKGHKQNNHCKPNEIWNGSECISTECGPNEVWNGSECVPNISCPVGQRYNGIECVPIVCPENTHLQGNLCIADGNITVVSSDNTPVYGVNSEDEDVFNIYSSPQYPADVANIEINKQGNGNAYGVYGISNVFNSYNVGEIDGVVNPVSSSVGNISITSNGRNPAYGIYAKISDITQYKEAINASAWNNGNSYGNININHTGGGDAYGVFGDVRAYNTFTAYGGNAYGNINIHGDGDIYGVSGYVAATNALSPFFGHEVVGNINLYQEGNKDVYGMMVNKDDIPGAGAGDGNTRSWFAFNAYSSGGNDDVEGNINIRNYGTGNAYGMYGGRELYNAKSFGGVNEETGEQNGAARGNINILNTSIGSAYGMYLPDEDDEAYMENTGTDGAQSTINIVNAGNGSATGMRGGRGVSIVNSGQIDINNLGQGTAYGIYAESNANVINSGVINIHRDAYTDSETGITYSPDGVMGGTAYGIYAENNANIVNSGTITITGAGAGKGIYLAQGAELENTGTVTFNGTVQDEQTPSSVKVNFNDMGGHITLGKGGQFFADEFSGQLGVSKKAVLNGFENEYVLTDALHANKVDALDVVSKSAMFEGRTKANDNGGYDVVLSRKNFATLLDDKNLADFYESNYNMHNNLALYNELELAETKKELKKEAANAAGTDVIPNFRKEDALIYRQLSRQFNDNLFNKPDENYIGGYKYIDTSLDKSGTLQGSDGTAHTAYGMLKGKNDNGITYGLGATVSQLKSDYDNGSSRKSNTFGLWAPVSYNFKNDAQLVSKLYAGYSDGSYDRRTKFGTYSADFNEYQYGLSNELRYKLALGNGFSFNSLAELNLLGIYQEGFDEGHAANALQGDSHNSLSLEGGLGAYLTKELTINENNKFGVQIGGIYYVEFLDPDDGTNTLMNGMSKKYKLRNKSQDGYAVFSARANYTYKDLMFYATLEKETARAKAFVIDTGIQYKF